MVRTNSSMIYTEICCQIKLIKNENENLALG